MRYDLVIEQGHVVFPGEGVRKADIAVKNGKIAAILYDGSEVDAARRIQANGLYVFPGLVDAHEHLGIYNSVAADFADTVENAIGGITTVVNFYREPKSYHEVMPRLIEESEAHSLIDFSYTLGVLTNQHLDEMEEYVEYFGLTSFKFFRNYERVVNTTFKTDDGIDLSAADLVRILKRMTEISPKMLLAVHCENMDIARFLTKELKHEVAPDTLDTWSRTSPGYAEAESLLSTLYLNYVVGGNVFLVHLSSGASVDALEKVRGWLLNSRAKVETCPHYLTLTTDSECGLKAKIGPPVHSESDRERLWEGIKTGLINAIGTDHCPNSLAQKFAKGQDVWNTLFAFPSAGTLLPLMITEGYHKRGVPLERIADITSRQVADSYNLPMKGRIEVGADADFAIVDLEREQIVTPQLFHSSTDYSVYEGMALKGWPVYTISRGDIIVDHGEPVIRVARGRYIRRSI